MYLPKWVQALPEDQQDVYVQKQRAKRLRPESLRLMKVTGLVLTKELLGKVFEYSPETGVLTKKVRTASADVTGLPLGSPHSQGYLEVGFAGKSYLVHRLVWILTHGEWPKMYLDHINGDRADNRLCNLRECSALENMRNQKLRKGTASGSKGVFATANGERWVASITIEGKTLYLGTYDTVPEAKAVYDHHAKLHFGEFYKQ